MKISILKNYFLFISDKQWPCGKFLTRTCVEENVIWFSDWINFALHVRFRLLRTLYFLIDLIFIIVHILRPIIWIRRIGQNHPCTSRIQLQTRKTFQCNGVMLEWMPAKQAIWAQSHVKFLNCFNFFNWIRLIRKELWKQTRISITVLYKHQKRSSVMLEWMTANMAEQVIWVQSRLKSRNFFNWIHLIRQELWKKNSISKTLQLPSWTR